MALASAVAGQAAAPASCGKGKQLPDGTCECKVGYSGRSCDQCAKEFYGYPRCRPKRECSCVFGTCDFTTGDCICPLNRGGKRCELCAAGFVGFNCYPASVPGAAAAGGGVARTLLAGTSWLLLLAAVAISAGLVWLLRRRSAARERYGQYAQVPREMDL